MFESPKKPETRPSHEATAAQQPTVEMVGYNSVVPTGLQDIGRIIGFAPVETAGRPSYF